jgi:ABC-type sulfate transport system substrate-binding protein
MKKTFKLTLSAIALAAASWASAQTTLLNVSYDVSREFYKDLNTAFVASYKKSTGKDIKVDQSHAGSSAQARAVADGLEADVVTMNTTTDVDFLAGRGVVAADWNKRFAHNAAPTTSTMLLQRNIGDVLVTFESEVVSVDREFGAGKVDAVHPSSSIVAENPVAIVERTVNKKGTAAEAKAYLDFLYTEEAQEIAAKHGIRPRSEAVLKRYASTFKPLKLFTVNEYFGSLGEAQKVHFNDGGQFDKLYTLGK